MLLSLTIRDFVLVDRLDLTLETGFTALTGETGAGKSILLDALDLALGGRADPGMLRQGAERAEIAAVFALDDAPGLPAWLEENGIEAEDGNCILRRLIDANGRSRAFINGRPATLGQLKEVGEHLVDIHGQHAHYSLLRPGEQRRMLDAYAGAGELAAQVAEAYRVWNRAEARYREASRQAREAGAEQERLQWVVEELERLGFESEAWTTLQEDHRRLAHAAELLQGAQAVVSSLDGDDADIASRLGEARGRLAELATIDAELAAPAAMLEDALVQVQEAARELSRYADRLELDPDALAELENRIAQVNDAARKYRVRPDDLPDLLAETRAKLAEAARLADPEGLLREAQAAEARFRELAGRLSGERRRAARGMAEAVTQAMQQLAMQGGRFEAALAACEAEAGGLETVEFQIAPHAGQGLKSLAKTASGGELSRIGLALQTVLSRLSGAATLIFDEVDTGIGGGVGEIVGHMLAELGAGRQVLCVTHLPQVAARAGQHWRVSKATRDGATLSRVDVLDSAGRVEEIARMLGGVKITDTTRSHAAEMLAGK